MSATTGAPPVADTDTDEMVTVRDLDVSFGATRVLHGVSMSIAAGKTVGVVGESGSGKSTLAKVLVGTVRPENGQVTVDTIDVTRISHSQRGAFAYRRRVQMIPQDPFSSLSPRRTIGQTLAEALDPLHARVRRYSETIAFWLERVGLSADMMARYPHEFSGGQRQRVAIARSLIVEPSFVIADEITSALDVSVQAQILELLAEIKDSLGVTMMFISHNLAVVQNVSDEVVVMYRGEVVESGPVAEIYADPKHWYTRTLLDADPGAPGFTLDL
ncbi:ABC transporter ATP-binding protein [Herbiconiux ginsengi]|uniref:Peptide/nickel transport system ATP-binding protein n=1 Tax=Herbiconiux ginsengi TaxID=381665 RepID=A0A1H3SWE7_9MICO|nr:ATP-binding cassette domain-containing protein [Herbiconiux ginsengi]SDZ42264.1 peptide/nickel transport system ATP-binding protein [Herbiconiux ginsengi]